MPRSRAVLVISWGLASLLGACQSSGTFACADDQACAGAGPEARCEANGWCSIEDDACGSGRRYGELAGDGLGGICVGDEPATGGPSTGGSSTGDASTGGLPTTQDPSLDEATSMDPGPPTQGWWDCGWAARRELVLDVPDTGEVLVDVPVLVVLDASRIDAAIMADDGRDLRFVAEDGATVLPHELEQWSPEALSWAWVRVPELPPGRTRLAMYYGNPEAEPLDGTQVWSGYTGVWHLGLEFGDASGTSAPATGMATTVAGQAGPAQHFTPPDDGIAVVPSPGVEGLFTRGGTITAMIRPSGWGGNGIGLVVGRADETNGDGGWVVSVDASREALRFARGFAQGRRTWYTPDGSLPLHAWRHVGVVYQDDPRGEPTFYVDGVPLPPTSQGMSGGSPEPDDAPELYVGGIPFTPSVTFDGILDEVRMAPLPRSAAWMTVELAVLRDELASYGPPESSPCASPG